MEKMIFKKSVFVKSITAFDQKPEDSLPEIAFAGRSNVGKSSLLNAMLNRRKLAKISSTPGKTQLINYFLINDLYHFVDLPGYGYAKISREIADKWQQMIESYLLQSKTLRMVCLLIDSRHEMLKSDRQMAEWLNYENLPYLIVLTKVDKLSKNRLQQQQNYYKKEFPDHHVLPFSVKSNLYIQQFVDVLFRFLK